jgi:hypothetical protein
MFSVMTWNLENLERSAANAADAVKDRYSRKLQQISDLITSAGPDLVGVQEVLADPKNLAHKYSRPSSGVGAEWTVCLSQPPDPGGIRVGWLARGLHSSMCLRRRLWINVDLMLLQRRRVGARHSEVEVCQTKNPYLTVRGASCSCSWVSLSESSWPLQYLPFFVYASATSR